jgi:hypothetical protein
MVSLQDAMERLFEEGFVGMSMRWPWARAGPGGGWIDVQPRLIVCYVQRARL